VAGARRHARRDPDARNGGGLAQREHRRRCPSLRSGSSARRYL